MTFADHLDELRRRILFALAGPAVAFLVIWIWFRHPLMQWILYPPAPRWRLFGYDILYLDMPELGFAQSAPTSAFVTFASICLIAAIIAAAPWIIYQVWAFVAAGLYPHERRAVRIYGLAAVLLFFAGAAFFYFLVYPISVSFLYGFGHDYNQYLLGQYGAQPQILNQTLLEGYVRFVLMLILVFGLMFQLPIAIMFLGRLGLVNVQSLCRYRRHTILALLIIAAIVTPPDVFSQIALALPMWGLYEIGILALRLTGAKLS